MKQNKIREKLVSLDKKSENIFFYFEKRMHLAVFLLFIISLIIRLSLTPFDSLLRYDEYAYLLKSLEIAKGNFIPIYSHSIGLSLFTAPLFYLFGSDSIFQNMVLAKIISAFIGSAIIFPLYLLARKLADNKIQLIALISFTFYPSLILSSSSSNYSFYPDNLFTFFFLFSAYFIINSIDKKLYVFPSFLFGALAYYTRPNGIFIFVILLISFLFLHVKNHPFKNFKRVYSYLIIGVLIFWIVSAPFLIQRHIAFGSPFDYSQASKHFVDSNYLAWSNNIEGPSFLDYLKTHTFSELFNRFIINGFFRIIFDFFHQMGEYKYSEVVNPLLIIFFIYGFAKKMFSRKFLPIYISFIIFIGGFSIIYPAFPGIRYFFTLIPFILIFSAIGIYDIFRKHEYNNLLLAYFLLVFVIFSLITPIGIRLVDETRINKAQMPSWALWAASNVQGKIATMGGDLVMMNLPDTSIAGVGQMDLYAPASNLSITMPGYFTDLASAMEYFKKTGVTHIALGGKKSDLNNVQIPYQDEIYLPKYKDWFEEVYSNHDSEWEKIIFKINWDEYKKDLKYAKKI